MPITFSSVGTTLLVTIIDENFKEVQDLLRSGIGSLDVKGQYERFQISRWTGGRIVAQHSYGRPPLLEETANNGVMDVTYRHGTEDVRDGFYLGTDVTDGSGGAYAMEQLGKPGPSMYLTWQEDGRAAPAGAVGWPPAYWPINRYPKELCYSKFLTVPFGTLRSYVDGPCVARVTATARGSLNMFRCLMAPRNVLGPFFAGQTFNKREANLGRFALIVDTNPELYDEWNNSNPNILDPVTGAQADYVSWKVLEDTTFNLPQRAHINMTSEVALAGRRYYSFSLKFRDAAHHGHVNTSTNTWNSGNWESSTGAANSPQFNAAWLALFTPFLFGGVTEYDFAKLAFYPSWINLWENVGISVEFFYGRDSAFTTDSASAEFTSKPR